MIRWVLRSTSAPTTNEGTITSIPIRIVHSSAIHPTSGRISSPGMIHSDATENPVARARGGIANDNTVRIPGATTASSAEIAQLRTTATTRFGDRANNAEHAACSQRRPRDEPDQAREVGGVPPRRDPRTDDETNQLERFGDRRCEAACPLVEAELLVVQQVREGDESDEADGEERE